MSKNAYLQKYTEACSVASVISDLLGTLWTVAHWALLSMRLLQAEILVGTAIFLSVTKYKYSTHNHCDKVGQCDRGPSLLLLLPNIPFSFSQFSLGKHNFPTPCDMSVTLFLLLEGGCVTRINQLECSVLLAPGHRLQSWAYGQTKPSSNYSGIEHVMLGKRQPLILLDQWLEPSFLINIENERLDPINLWK